MFDLHVISKRTNQQAVKFAQMAILISLMELNLFKIEFYNCGLLCGIS